METQKTSYSQSNIEKEKWNWRNSEKSVSLVSVYSTKLQSSKQYGTSTKTKILVEEDIKSRNKLKHIWSTDLLTKATRTHSGEKTISPISGAGKTGQLHVK